MRKKERLHVTLYQRSRVAAEHSYIHEPLRYLRGGRETKVAVFATGPHLCDSALPDAVDDLTELPLQPLAPTSAEVRARHVRGVCIDLGTGIDQAHLAIGHGALRWSEVQDSRVRSPGDDRAVCGPLGAIPDELRLDLDLQVPFGQAGPHHPHAH